MRPVAIAAKLLAAAYAGAMALAAVTIGGHPQAVDWLFSLLFYAWQLVPVLAAAWLACASVTMRDALAFLILEATLIAWTFWGWLDGFLLDPGPWTSADFFLFMPLTQCAVLVAFALAALVGGWRPRRG